jgi:hypothetical protein
MRFKAKASLLPPFPRLTPLHRWETGGKAVFGLSGGNVPDGVEGRLPPETTGTQGYTGNLLVDKAYKDGRLGRRSCGLKSCSTAETEPYKLQGGWQRVIRA